MNFRSFFSTHTVRVKMEKSTFNLMVELLDHLQVLSALFCQKSNIFHLTKISQFQYLYCVHFD